MGDWIKNKILVETKIWQNITESLNKPRNYKAEFLNSSLKYEDFDSF